MKQPSDTLYQTLTASERARLAFAALARGDHAELKRITDTCPLENYRAPEHEYTATVGRLFELALSLECEGRGQVIELLSIMPHRYESEAMASAVLEKVAEMCKRIGLQNGRQEKQPRKHGANGAIPRAYTLPTCTRQ